MAQAIYTDDTQAAIRQRLAQTQNASAATQARAASNLPTPRISVTDVDPASLSPSESAAYARAGGTPAPTVDVASRAQQLANQTGATNVPGSDVPAAARRVPGTGGISSTEINPSSLSASERAAFARQGATFTDAVPPPSTAAPAVNPAASSVVDAGEAGRINSALTGAPAARATGGALATAGRTLARGAGALGVAADAYGAVQNARAGNYADAATDTGLGALDTAALAAPSPITAGAALTGHVANYAFGENGPLSFIPAAIASGLNGILPSATYKTADQYDQDRRDFQAQRAAAGLPVPADRQPNITVRPPISSGVVADASSTAPTLSPSPAIAALPTTNTGYGKVVNGVPTYSDGSGNPNSKGYVPRTMSQQEINGLANGNRISIADAGIGGLISTEANGGKTLNLGDGPVNRGPVGFTAADRARQSADIERQGNNYEFNRLMQNSQTQLARGNKKTAAILASLAGNYKTSEAPQETPSAAALNQAKIAQSTAEAQNATSEARHRNTQSGLIDQALGEPNDDKRETIYDTLLASQGKNSGRVVTLKVPDPNGAVDQLGNPVMNEVPFDTRSRQFLYTPKARQQQPASIAR